MKTRDSKLPFGWLAALAVCLLPGVAAQTPRISNTYILTQATCIGAQPPPPGSSVQCPSQTVPVGAKIWIQLPGNPARWAVDMANSKMPNLKLLSSTPAYIDSPNRIPGTNGIYQFELLAVSKGTATIKLNWNLSAGSYTFTITVP